jgi:hypothetical protein
MCTNKVLLLAVICICLNFQTNGQIDITNQNALKHKKVYLSVSAGKDYSIGTSNTGFIFNEENNYYPLPFSKGFGGSFNGAYFFSQNYGAGMKYHLYKARFADNTTFDPYNEFVLYVFDEMTHFVGGAAYGRWTLATSRWETMADISVGYVYNKLSKITALVYNHMHETGQRQQYANIYPIGNISGGTIGVMFSAGIQYQITSSIGIGVSGHGMFTSLPARDISDSFFRKIGNNTSRKPNRIGVSGGLNFKF